MKSTPSLSDEIKNNIFNRILLCVLILTIAHIITIGFYINLFANQTKNRLNNLSAELTPYIISQEIIENRYAINLKLEEVSRNNNIKVKFYKQPLNKKPGIVFINITNWNYTVPVKGIDKKYYGYYVISGSLLDNQWMTIGLSIQLLFLMIFIILIIFILYPIAYSIPKKIIINPIDRLVSLLHKNNPAELDLFSAPHEIILLRDHFIKILSKQNEILKKTEILKIASQVAHDIRSPLTAINVAISDVSSIPETKRIMIKNASQRIMDIANNLLLKAKGGPKEENYDCERVFSELVFVILNNIITEKRYEYINRSIIFKIDISESSYATFAVINLAAFNRILSNLINNSIEAITNNGEISIFLDSYDSNVEIKIQDNGCGIPDNIICKVMESGFSFNKKEGAGLGLAYVKQEVEKMDGEIILSSSINIGTQITIKLPRAAAPAWFCNNLNLNNHDNIIVLDDDPSIHEAWNDKLSLYRGITITHFYKASDVITYRESSNTDFYLIDYELLNDNMNGLDLIKKVGLEKRALLVTNCFENNTLRSTCEKSGVKIIPKPFVPYIPISMISNDTPNNIILIDNDEMIRAAWLLAAKASNLSISTYASSFEFNNDINKHCKNSVIYIDSDLGEAIPGEEYAKSLYAYGFLNLYLATGHAPEQFDNLPWIKSIVSKDPPF